MFEHNTVTNINNSKDVIVYVSKFTSTTTNEGYSI